MTLELVLVIAVIVWLAVLWDNRHDRDLHALDAE